MTSFGKILVFMNLLFSVVTGFLIIMVFDKRTDWKTKYDKVERRAEAAELAYKSEKLSHDNDLKQKDSASAGLVIEVNSLKDRLTATQQESAKLLDDAQKDKQATAGALVNSEKIEAELAQLKEERQKLVDEKQAQRVAIVKVQQELDAQRSLAVNESLQAKSLLSKNSNLLRQLEELTVRLREAEQNGGSGLAAGGGTPGGNSVLNPPARPAPPGVRGRVTAVGREGTFLAQINVGSDSGLSAGNVLVIYRGDIYVGDLTITGTEPKVAVGKFTPAKRNMAVQVDDAVITSFTSAN